MAGAPKQLLPRLGVPRPVAGLADGEGQLAAARRRPGGHRGGDCRRLGVLNLAASNKAPVLGGHRFDGEAADEAKRHLARARVPGQRSAGGQQAGVVPVDAVPNSLGARWLPAPAAAGPGGRAVQFRVQAAGQRLIVLGQGVHPHGGRHWACRGGGSGSPGAEAVVAAAVAGRGRDRRAGFAGSSRRGGAGGGGRRVPTWPLYGWLRGRRHPGPARRLCPHLGHRPRRRRRCAWRLRRRRLVLSGTERAVGRLTRAQAHRPASRALAERAVVLEHLRELDAAGCGGAGGRKERASGALTSTAKRHQLCAAPRTTQPANRSGGTPRKAAARRVPSSHTAPGYAPVGDGGIRLQLHC